MADTPRILHLTLKKKWFDMVASGAKDEEYREIKDYWVGRLENGFDLVSFRNGYGANAPKVVTEFKGLSVGEGFYEWGAPVGRSVFKIKLGKIIQLENVKYFKRSDL